MRRIVCLEGEVFQVVRFKEERSGGQAVRIGITDHLSRENVVVMDVKQAEGFGIGTKAKIVLEVETAPGGSGQSK